MITNVLEFLERAEKHTPDKIVFSDPENSVTYSECVSRARAIGTYLGRTGRKNSPAAVLIDRDIESIEMFLGVVYSGNFYVPVGKNLPAERIRMILESMEPCCILAQKSDRDFLENFPFQEKVSYLEDMVGTEPDEILLKTIRAGHLDTDPLYAIYTSGSTGKPKGVLVSHRSVIDLAEQFSACFGFDSEDVFGNQAPFDFDVSVKDIYCTLQSQAALCIVPAKLISFPKLLIPYMNERRISVTIWAVSALAVVAGFKGLKRGRPEYLKKILFSGEVMPLKVLNYWRENIPDAMYVNLYGPTEITCNCTYYILDREFDGTDEIPIGKAFPNTEILLLKEDNTLAGENETGEICVRGSSLALGYYKNREITEKAFCQNPLNPDYPERIYRTGDMGRWISGELFFSGRRDFQIKHMGHRIELGEIERVMDSLPFSERNCCIYDEKHEKIYMFYQGETDRAKEIAVSLQEKLPKYMCPNKYVFMKEIPLNKNGKLDRTRLREEYINGGQV